MNYIPKTSYFQQAAKLVELFQLAPVRDHALDVPTIIVKLRDHVIAGLSESQARDFALMNGLISVKSDLGQVYPKFVRWLITELTPLNPTTIAMVVAGRISNSDDHDDFAAYAAAAACGYASAHADDEHAVYAASTYADAAAAAAC